MKEIKPLLWLRKASQTLSVLKFTEKLSRVVGLGAIGVKVANAAHHLGMNVVGYDPYLSRLTQHGTLLDLLKSNQFRRHFLAQSDYITIHVPALPSTIGMVI